MTSKTYNVTISIVDWYGGEKGYGLNSKDKKAKKKFATSTDALRWAYSEVYKYRDKPKTRNTKVVRCSVDLDNGEYIYSVELHNYKVRVWYSRPNGMLSRGFLLNKDGTINFRGGGIE